MTLLELPQKENSAQANTITILSGTDQNGKKALLSALVKKSLQEKKIVVWVGENAPFSHAMDGFIHLDIIDYSITAKNLLEDKEAYFDLIIDQNLEASDQESIKNIMEIAKATLISYPNARAFLTIHRQVKTHIHNFHKNAKKAVILSNWPKDIAVPLVG